MTNNIHSAVKGLELIASVIGRLIAWLTLFMVIITFTVVVMRYWFDTGSIILQESITYLHAMVFLLGAAFTLQQDEHVRVDVLYRVRSNQGKAWIDMLGCIIFLLPVCAYILVMSWDYVALSWRIGETSNEAGGLPALYLLKSLLLIMPVLMIIEGIAWILSRANFLFLAGPCPYTKDSKSTIEVEL